ncbi:PAS domain-containing sensor histidine kinase [Hymenobacter sp. BT175]|uniref:sensor histidine kinase n=1 Tax=Hymenobacter translucens TaxID=2886507 RepID=UPI001D0F1DE1|nr:PAS domain-containing sensor histidine kinase [Hymenobacter translucens]MCC2547793.1 PAS domain-containing sensor histidine kinase [Hymenobacter translucens]
MSLSPFTTALTDVLITQAAEFVGVYDATRGWFTQVNPAGVRLLGYPSEQAFLDEPSRTLPTPSFSADDWAALRERARRSGRQEVETTISRPEAEPIQARIELIYFEVEGRPFYLVRLSEQTRLQQAERELAQSVRRFEAVFANATIGIIVCNRTGAIVTANQMAHQQFGYAEGELTGQQIEVLVPMGGGPHHEKLRESFNERPSVRAMGAHRGDLEARRKDNSVFPVEVSLSYFYLDQELFVVSYVLDITYKRNADLALIAERQRVERLNAELEQKVADRTHALLSTLEQLEQRKDELAKALAAEQELGELKSRFVSMASHEFRTPLTAVLTSASLIEKYPATEQQDKRLRHLDRIRQSVNHLNDILEEFLSVGRIEEGKVEARPARLSLPDLVQDTIADVQGLLKPGQTIAPEVSCPRDLWLDSSLLRKILVNLLSNAIKYSGENSVVTVQAACADGQLRLRVQDQGVGISQEDQERLFERFFRARNVTNVPGTGLGLYIIAKYLELMHGTIDLQSTLDVGTTVTLTIPYEDHSAD